MLSGEATNTNFIVFGLTRPGFEPTIYRTRGEHVYHYATDAVICACGKLHYFLGIYWSKLMQLVCLLTEDGSEAKTETLQTIWGQTKFEIVQRCRRKHKLLPSSAYCNGSGNPFWTNVFRVEENFEIKTGK